MWNQCRFSKEIMEDGWTTRQNWQKDAVDNRAFRLPKMQETVQSCSRQKEDLDD
jgi:hypothetical protein